MLTAVRGALVSEEFAEHLLGERFAGRLGERERDAARRALAHLSAACASLGPASTVRAIADVAGVPLADLLGFRVVGIDMSGRRGPDRPTRGLAGTAPDEEEQPAAVWLERDGARLVLLVTPYGKDLHAAWLDGVRAGIRADVRWCLLFNARQLRLVDAVRTYNRDHLEFDLERLPVDPAAFDLFWAVLRPAAFGPPGRPLLDEIIAASARHGVGVCRSLQEGVLEAIGTLMQGFVEARVVDARLPVPGVAAETASPLTALFDQSLTIVYRILFLLFAEARRLVPVWHRIYRDAYSIDALRAAAENQDGRAVPGVWESLRAISRLAHRGCHAGSLVVTPFNGRLFSPARTPLGESPRLGDQVARRVVLLLSTDSRRRGEGRARIAYRDLGVEQLGAVYEGVLEYEPRVVPAPEVPAREPRAESKTATDTPLHPPRRRGRGGDARNSATCSDAPGGPRGQATRVSLERGSTRRKATGTFYTPQSVTGYLVRRTLHPLVAGRGADHILGLRVLDPAMGSGAFLVAACQYLAAAYERALVAEGRCHGGDVDERDRVSFRRLVAQRCLFGVDVNPMAVQLARLSLWLATLSADRPLTFLDHHLGVGDSLVGASPLDVLRYPGTRFAQASRREHPTLFPAEEWHDAVGRVLPDRLRVALEPGDSLAEVKDKERIIERLGRDDGPLARWKQVADLWCACWFSDAAQIPSRGAYHDLVNGLLERGSSLPGRTADALIGRAQQVARARRFFHWSIEFPEVCCVGVSGHDGVGFDAVIGNPPWDMLRADAGRSAEDRSYDRALVNFARQSRLYHAQGDGHSNRFQLFVERAFRLARPGGRLGLVVPWGLLSDRGCRDLRRLLFERADTDTLIGFDNTKRIFPIHRSLRFALITATTGRPTGEIRCRFGETDAVRLDSLPGDLAASSTPSSSPDGPGAYPIVLSPSLLRRLSGEDLDVPDLRSPIDLEIAAHAAATFPALASAAGWSARFGRELNATDDRQHLGEKEGGLPVVEGKHLEPFHARVDRATLHIRSATASRLLDARTTFGRARLAYRDVASATNRVTLIAAVLPAGCVTTHTVFCLKTPLEEDSQWLLCAIMNSYVANYLVRLRVTTHVSAGIVERLPVPVISTRTGTGAEMASTARNLSRQPAANDDDLQAIVAGLYRLSPAQFTHILSTFPLVDEERRRGALEAFVTGGPRQPGSRR